MELFRVVDGRNGRRISGEYVAVFVEGRRAAVDVRRMRTVLQGRNSPSGRRSGMRRAAKLSGAVAPVVWPPVAVGDGDDFNPICALSEDDQIRESTQFDPASVCRVRREARGGVDGLADGAIEFLEEHLRGARATVAIPRDGGLGFGNGLGVEPDGLRGHRLRRAARRRRASSQGRSETAPESISARRRRTSACQASSAAKSVVGSRLSMSESTRTARASGGRASASWRISAASRVIPSVYVAGKPRVRAPYCGIDPGERFTRRGRWIGAWPGVVRLMVMVCQTASGVVGGAVRKSSAGVSSAGAAG